MLDHLLACPLQRNSGELVQRTKYCAGVLVTSLPWELPFTVVWPSISINHGTVPELT